MSEPAVLSNGEPADIERGRSERGVGGDRDHQVVPARGVAPPAGAGRAARRGSRARCRRGGRPGRGERVGQEHPHEDPGRRVGRRRRQVRVSGRIGYCPQEPVLYDRLTCDEHLELFGVAYGMDTTAVATAAEALYATLGFDRWRAARVEELSGGTRAKLNLALALLADPDVLLLDEPYAGFDWDTYQRFWDLTAQRRAPGAPSS